jgi:hypothetical protein
MATVTKNRTLVKLQVLGNNSKTVNNIKNLTWGKNDQHIKIYQPCNFEVNLIAHLGLIALFSSNEKIFEKVYDVQRRRMPSDGNSLPDPLGQVS